ncbi:type VI secretion protein IcmF/TssM N-terminal domain-containing protein [Variovorax sp. Varisp41]|jgi:type VI secretion system protein ImpL|uniref:type VI secretion protein IcmF/TssM N-terminal domain-containing protein n=1 Tax=Variovorax sp. Varisp41 TaxID=3243033 RepID=UPI0039B4BDA0
MHTLPPAHLFWPLLALCALGFAVLCAVVRDAGRGARQRALKQRIATLRPPARAADAQAVERLHEAMARAQQRLRLAPRPRAAGENADDGDFGGGAAPRAPWLLFLGDAAAGLPGLLAASPLDADPSDDAPAGPVRDGWRWWTGGAMAAIEIDARVLEDVADAPQARALWLASLLALAERRERIPLHGIVACIGAQALREAPTDAVAFRMRIARLRRLVEEIGRTLRLQLPFYLVVTGLEGLEGYGALRGALPPEVLAQALGHRLPLENAAPEADGGARLDAVFEPIATRLHALRMGLQREQPGAAGRLAVHAFVEGVRSLRPGLRLAAEALFESHGRKAREARGLRWRGLYLSAAAGTSGGNGAFVADLFDRFLPADQSLARPGRLPPEDRDAGLEAM